MSFPYPTMNFGLGETAEMLRDTVYEFASKEKVESAGLLDSVAPTASLSVIAEAGSVVRESPASADAQRSFEVVVMLFLHPVTIFV